jgi:two-component SAPR family response regulator
MFTETGYYSNGYSSGGEINGIIAAKEICRHYTPKIIFISAYPVYKDEIHPISPHYLQKPVSESELLRILK